MFTRRILAGALALGLAVVAGCSSDEPADEQLPDGPLLIEAAATAMGSVNSAHFGIEVRGDIPGLSVRGLEGDLTKEGGPSGGAKGTGTLDQGGQLVEVEFVLAGDTLYLKGPTGDFQEIPVQLSSAVYDPSAVLDPERGIAKVLGSMRNPTTEAREEVDGTPAYKVTGTVAKDVLGELVPGVPSDADIAFWLRAEGERLPVKATATFGEGQSVDVRLSEVNKPVTVNPPE
ncbi:LppX_LprAFG lipoprotein [Amycolatopsis cihanbeyliensis]|uniref:Lipoprotein LprG n=1 Tax=Amycolatopsis cihanbeyliensis TaxID=1128664 RepID=A0A542DNN8_AMYCI|nr:LppX_LprAFG lipoprotein [Amycolatopsis cihanbeyliensis]TQJ04708.1 lipoprotein LprG [Amycolatopsis cihanbeyliensis]